MKENAFISMSFVLTDFFSTFAGTKEVGEKEGKSKSDDILTVEHEGDDIHKEDGPPRPKRNRAESPHLPHAGGVPQHPPLLPLSNKFLPPDGFPFPPGAPPRLPSPPGLTGRPGSPPLTDKDRFLNLMTSSAALVAAAELNKQNNNNNNGIGGGGLLNGRDFDGLGDVGKDGGGPPLSATAMASVQAALAALQAGQMSLNQVRWAKCEVNLGNTHLFLFQLSVQLMALGAQSPGIFQSQLAAVAARQLGQQSQSSPTQIPPNDIQVKNVKHPVKVFH